jgi:hypothetical protein
MKTIEVLVSPSGETTIETKGFAGAECQQASTFLEQALGQCQSETLTAEYHTSQQAEVTNRQQN